jgi:hypothetical protein
LEKEEKSVAQELDELHALEKDPGYQMGIPVKVNIDSG